MNLPVSLRARQTSPRNAREDAKGAAGTRSRLHRTLPTGATTSTHFWPQDLATFAPPPWRALASEDQWQTICFAGPDRL